MALKAFREDGTEVRPGEVVTDFRGDQAVFHAATRAPNGRRTGKVQVGGPFGSEYYMTVFKLTVREI
jgi:hypothetical protein